MVEIVDRTRWAPSIGRFMLAFGSIESSVNDILQHWCSPQTWLFLSSSDLGRKVKFLRGFLAEQDISDRAKKVLQQNLDDVAALMKTRNLIAHNPLGLALFEVDNSSPAFREAIFSTRDEGKHVTLQKLMGLTDQAEAVDQAMAQNAASIKLHGRAFFHAAEGHYQAELDRPAKD